VSGGTPSRRRRFLPFRVRRRAPGPRGILVVVALLVALGAGYAVLRQTSRTGDKLLWAPPSMTSPKTITLESGLDPDHLQLNPKRDYVLKVPSGGLHGTIEIDGGHNVTLIGGSVTVPSSATQTDNGANNTDTAIYVRHSTGIVHIEGVLIKADHDVEYDGIDVNAPEATVEIENIRMQALYGSKTTEHADAIQTWGGAKVLDIDNLTADGDYQGLTISPDLGSVGTANIHDVDLTADPRPAALANHTVGGGIMLWLTRATSCDGPRTSLDNVYVIDDSGRVASTNTVWPSSSADLSCHGIQKGGDVFWPRLPVRGFVRLGSPPHGSFVPNGVAGEGYTSPGYR
jgi:hypothetical protein